MGHPAKLVLAFIIVFSIFAANAQVPNTLSFQGTLTDQAGQPITGTRSVTLSLYTVASAGTPFWKETQTVSVISGRFSAVLGSSSNPLNSANFTGETYIGIKVGSDAEMPRQKLTSVAYAFSAGNVANAIPRGVIVMWSGTVNQIPSGWALCNGTNGTPDLRNRFIVGAGGSYSPGNTGGIDTNNITHTHLIPGHNHSYSGTTGQTTAVKQVDNGGDAHDGVTDYHTHTYSGTTSFDGDKSTGNSTLILLENRPPYYALAYIMKL